jgi:hypothetical protein
LFAPNPMDPLRAANPNYILLVSGSPGHFAHNGCPPTTLPEPIKRARYWDTNGVAGEGNVAERSERYASEEKPDEPRSLSRIKPVQTRSVGGLVT